MTDPMIQICVAEMRKSPVFQQAIVEKAKELMGAYNLTSSSSTDAMNGTINPINPIWLTNGGITHTTDTVQWSKYGNYTKLFDQPDQPITLKTSNVPPAIKTTPLLKKEDNLMRLYTYYVVKTNVLDEKTKKKSYELIGTDTVFAKDREAALIAVGRKVNYDPNDTIHVELEEVFSFPA